MASSLRNKVLRRLRRGLPEASVQGDALGLLGAFAQRRRKLPV